MTKKERTALVESLTRLCADIEKNGKAYLHPENKKYADIPLHDCKIQGIAVSVTRKLDAKGRTGK